MATLSQFSVSQSPSLENLIWENETNIQIDKFTINAYGKLLYDDATLAISTGNKYGLIGANGQGKSTLLKLIASGELKIPPKIDFLYVEQEVEADDINIVDVILMTNSNHWDLLQKEKDISCTDQLSDVYEQLNRYSSNESQVRSILVGLGFTPEMQKKTTMELSGGWRMRLSIAKALYMNPDLLMLDEPSNHLDLNAVIWLENYLQKYKKTLIIISHNADFLNNICTHILHVHKRKLDCYKGNYDQFKHMEYQKQIQYEKAWKTQQKKLTALKQAGNSTKKALTLLKSKLLEPPKEYRVRFDFPESTSIDHSIIEVDNVCFGYKDNQIFDSIDFGVDINSRVCIVGANGVGKSTLLKIITGEVQPLSGEITRNQRARFGIYNQHFVDSLPTDVSPVEYLLNIFPKENAQSIRNNLGRVGLEGFAHMLPIFQLSGGQKARVVFAKLILLQPHILILDEPTNHLDIESIEALIKSINTFDGAVVLISHDSKLIEATNCVLWVCEDKSINIFDGEFSEYKQSIL